MKKTTRITVESRRVVVISGGGGSTLQWCPVCNHEVQMLTPEDASAVAHVRTRSVYRWIETGLVHFSETRDGFLLICINSLPNPSGSEHAEAMPQLETVLKAEPRSQS